MIYDGNEDIKRAYKQGYADARVAEAEATKERIAATPEPLAPLTDERVRELSNLARNGPDVVAMAQEVVLSRERIALLEADRDEALRVRDLAREASNRDLKRAAEGENARLQKLTHVTEERCESCGKSATRHDIDDIPLCRKCYGHLASEGAKR